MRSDPHSWIPPAMAAPEPDVFGDWERFEKATPPAPCRRIEVTPEMRAADARRKREEAVSVASNWRNRVAPAAQPIVQKPAPIPRKLPVARREVQPDPAPDSLPEPVPVLDAIEPEPQPAQLEDAIPECGAGCGRKIKKSNRTGFCWRCAKVGMPKLRVVMTAESLEEHEANQLWASLRFADRLALLEMAGGGVTSKARKPFTFFVGSEI